MNKYIISDHYAFEGEYKPMWVATDMCTKNWPNWTHDIKEAKIFDCQEAKEFHKRCHLHSKIELWAEPDLTKH